jgi:hypothetical protein
LVISSSQSPESLASRLRALADKRQKEAARENRVIAQGLIGAAHGYRAIADALEQQPELPWLRTRRDRSGDTTAQRRTSDFETAASDEFPASVKPASKAA